MSTKTPIDYEGKYRIEVTEADIACAIPGDPSNCAVAMAVKRMHPEITYIKVSKERIAFTDRVNRKRVELKTTVDIKRGEILFDADRYLVRPEDFGPGGVVELDLKEATVEDIGFTPEIQERQNKRREDTRKGLRVPTRKVPEEELVARRRIRRLA
jgi:hypothetical protein